MNTEAPCTLRYTPLSFLHPRNRNTMKNGLERLRREQSCNMSLLRPEECFTSFPIDRDTADRCCAAWKAGSAASQFVKLELAIPSNPNGTGNLLYTVTGKGWSSPNQRSGMMNANYYIERNPLKDLVEAHGLLNHDELYSAASRHLDRQSSQWLLKQTTGTTDSGEDYIFDNQMTDLSKDQLVYRISSLLHGLLLQCIPRTCGHYLAGSSIRRRGLGISISSVVD